MEEPSNGGANLCRETYTVTGMDCGECAVKIDRALSRLPGVQRVNTAFASSRLSVAFDPSVTSEAAIRREVSGLGYEIHGSHEEAQRAQPILPPARVLSMVVAGAFLLLGWLTRRAGVPILGDVFYLVSIGSGGWPVFRAAAGSLRALVLGDINVLMSIAVVGAAALGKWDEAATVLFLFATGDWLEMYAMDRTRQSVRSLMALAPPTARVVRGGAEVDVPSRTVEPGETIRVRAGDRIALDAEVVAGHSAVDQSTLTGESLPVEAAPGAIIYAGTLNGDGTLEARVLRAEADSAVAQIAEMVQEAQARKAPSERFVARFSRVYTPAVIGAAALLALAGPLVWHQPFSVWAYRALTLLVASCPCALVISTPVAIVCALGAAARRGILIKGGAAVEAAARVKAVAFDKTGTLTEGLPAVAEVVTLDGVDADSLAGLAAALEAHSTHPLADAVRRHARERRLNVPEAAGTGSVPGMGVSGVVEGVPFWIGSLRSVENQDVPGALLEAADRAQRDGQTVLVLSSEAGPLGLIAVADAPRRDSLEAIAALREDGIERIAILTGDGRRAAASLARAVGVDSVHAELLPADKRAVVEEMERTGPVAMVGDGVNDAPALAAATLGVAMGAVGSHAAIEAADIALMGDDLRHVPEALALSRRTMATIRQNVWLSLGVKAAFLLAVLAGQATLWMAVVADSGTAVLVTLNAMRLMKAPRAAPRAGGGTE